MRRGLLALCATLILSACSFWSEQPLFDPHEATTPFANGAHFTWRADDGSEERIVYRRAGQGYQLSPPGDEDEHIIAIFLPISSTPEDDYIIQVQMRRGEVVRAYAFMWRTETGHRFIVAPSAFRGETAEAELDELCAQRTSRECKLRRREDVLRLYREMVYPAFVVGNQTPANFMDQLLIEDSSAK